MKGSVKGRATYRERMALPPGAVLEATLEDVSKADARAEIIGQTRVEQPGNPPIRFDSSRIDPRRRYAVRARIMVEGKPFLTTEQNYPVLTAGKGNEVEVVLRKVSASRTATEPLENTYWKLMRLGDAPVAVAPRQRKPADPRPGHHDTDGVHGRDGDREGIPGRAQLELLDAGGQVVARLEAGHLE